VDEEGLASPLASLSISWPHPRWRKITKEIRFLVQGSEAEPYSVVFGKTGTNLTATCTCKAGERGQHCKHRTRILLGETTGIVSDNAEDVPEIQDWLNGSDVEQAMIELRKAERDLEEAKKRVSLLKKRLSRSLVD
jgi:uncharacterized Zn finger protein